MPGDLTGIAGIEFRQVKAGDLADDGLSALANLAARDDYEGCKLLSCHRADDGATEAVVIEVYVELGQAKRENDVREREPVAVLTDPTCAMPTVYPLRGDFPQRLPHMNINYRGRRRSLCLFDAHADDIAHLYNPAMLVERMRWWMQKSAYSELHGTDQPLDPALAPSFWNLVLPPDFDAKVGASYAALRRSQHLLAPLMLVPWDCDLVADAPQFACSHVVTQATNHGAMIDLPENVAELIDIYSELDVDLIVEIRKLFAGDLNDPKLCARLKQGLLLLITTPLTDAVGEIRAKTTRAFMSQNVSLLDVAKALGIASDEGGAVGHLLAAQPDNDELQRQRILPLNVVEGFAPDSAQASSGRVDMPNRNMVAIGLGALGSQAVLNLARMGQTQWSLIDQDFVAPHNLARHAASGYAIGHSKAEVIAQELNELFQKQEAIPLHEAINGEETSQAVLEALEKAERVIDFSASVRVARWLASSESFEAPVSSYFVNPAGTALISLHEGQNRRVRGGVVEMAYYGLLLEHELLHAHLATSGQVQVGSCRDVSATIPQSQMALFAGLSAADIDATHDLPEACVTIWSLGDNYEVKVHRVDVPQFEEVTLNGWTIMVAPDVAATIAQARGNGDVETGGVLLGGFDLDRKTLVVIAALPSPADSDAGRTYYERGIRGVQSKIEEVERITMRHVTYIGEWHTHPTGSSSAPSDLDNTLLGWVADLRQLFLMPGLLLILGDDGLRAVLQKDAWTGNALMLSDVSPRWTGLRI